MILTATGYGLGTLWIANTCFAYNELMDFIGTASQLTGIVAVGFAYEAPAKRPRKPLEEIVEYRIDRKIGLIKIFNIMCLAFEVWKG